MQYEKKEKKNAINTHQNIGSSTIAKTISVRNVNEFLLFRGIMSIGVEKCGGVLNIGT